MTKNDEREVQRKLRVLQHAEREGHAKTVPKNPPNQTPPEVAEKVLHLRRKYHLGPERIMWYLARYHGIKLSDATIYRTLKRNGVNRLLRGTRLRKVHTKRYNKQVPGHHIQMDAHVPDFHRKEGREDTSLPIYGH